MYYNKLNQLQKWRLRTPAPLLHAPLLPPVQSLLPWAIMAVNKTRLSALDIALPPISLLASSTTWPAKTIWLRLRPAFTTVSLCPAILWLESSKSKKVVGTKTPRPHFSSARQSWRFLRPSQPVRRWMKTSRPLLRGPRSSQIPTSYLRSLPNAMTNQRARFRMISPLWLLNGARRALKLVVPLPIWWWSLLARSSRLDDSHCLVTLFIEYTGILSLLLN